MKHFHCMLVGLASLAAALPAVAAEHFQGLLDDRGRPVAVTLTLMPADAQGAVAGTLRFDGAWACGFELELASTPGAASHYFLKGAGAGRCEVLTAGYLHSEPAGAGVAVELRDQGNSTPALHRLTMQPIGG